MWTRTSHSHSTRAGRIILARKLLGTGLGEVLFAMELLKWRQEGAGTCLSSIGSHICQRARQEEEHRINDSRECGLRHHQVNQDQGWRRQEFKKVHLPAEISTPFYSHGSDMSIEVVVKLSPSGSVYCRRRHCTCAKRPRVSGVRLGKPGPVTRSRSIGGFFFVWMARTERPTTCIARSVRVAENASIFRNVRRGPRPRSKCRAGIGMM